MDTDPDRWFPRSLYTLSLIHIFSFSPDDENALWGYSNYVNNEQYNKVVNYFYLFLWIVGLSTLLIGIVGVSNIMLVTVRERYKEIGIRKALGAKPRDILAMIMVESLLITAVAGAIGLVIAVGLVALGDYLVTAYPVSYTHLRLLLITRQVLDHLTHTGELRV